MLFVAAALAVSAAHAAAQHRPDLSGTWTSATAAPSGLPAAPTPVFGPEFELRHAGDALTIVRTIRDRLVSATHVLDGRESRTTIPGPLCQGDALTIETAAWEGDAVALTIVGSVPPGGGAPGKANVKRLFRLQDADTLVVEGTTSQGGKRTQVGTVYKRSPQPLTAATASPPVKKAEATIARVGWLAGVWTGTAGQSTVEERWTPAAGGSMLAVARTLRNTTMVAFEFLCIAERDGSLVYTAMPNGRTPPTHFVLTSITADVATFENPSHDYPRMIRYARKADGSLETTIAGEGGQRTESVVLKKQGHAQ
jgi:Domain of unknown function (DUF6265)